MGRRSRRTQRSAPGPSDLKPDRSTRQARVRVDDDTWRDFRTSLRGGSIADELGRLVTREMRHWRIRQATDDTTSADLFAAVAEAKRLQKELTHLVVVLDRRLEEEIDRGAAGQSRDF
jgi:hypothetical protein